MRPVSPNLTPEIQGYIGSMSVAEADAYPIGRFRDLVKHIARLAVLNKDYMLLYRGQGRDHRNKAGRTTLYPTIYRGSRLTSTALQSLFANLERAASRLRALIRSAGLEGQADASKRLVLWSLLQHYEVCATPLLDLTSSIRVACSFALHDAIGGEVYIYVCALPYVKGRISLDSEHDLVNVRLLGICPPDALRPVFQEGYLAETYEITTNFSSKDILDFNRRLVAKFRIPIERGFWGETDTIVPREELYPSDDPLLDIVHVVKEFLGRTESVGPGEVGHFLDLWSTLEGAVIALASLYARIPKTMSHAIRILTSAGVSGDFRAELDDIRQLRNQVVHSPSDVSPEELRDALDRIPLLAVRTQELYARASAEGTIDGGVWE